MSVPVTKAVWRDSEATGMSRLVLLCLADSAGRDDAVTFKGVDTVAEECRMDAANVRRCIRGLVDSGELVRVDSGGGRGRPARFRINLGPWRETVSTGQGIGEPKPGHSDTETVELNPVKTRSSDTVNPVKTRSKPGHGDLPTPYIDLELEPEPIEPEQALPVKRARNEVWEAFAFIFGEPTTDSNRRLRGKVVASVRRAGGTYDEVIRRAAAWPAHFEVELTETALEKHWDRLARPPLRATKGQVRKVQAAMDREAQRAAIQREMGEA